MTEADALEILRISVWAMLLASAPAVFTAMAVGLVISLFQALTQVQESTLSFAPKIVAVFVALAVAAPFIGGQLNLLVVEIFSHVQSGF
ncbi:flagellar biosynthesis protein FliQ [Rhizobium sp. CFBP 13726]|uniref:flagellar biosynthesis protein FliQ n=1 Tax=Rhizobium sp. CFBP 13726 TaxID=2775296 RepID=UPI001784A7A3|nr:flagellar biosynthesis protein FliQ [Rhizobium sp. CFBP 13726]MBD8652984.1 flagellar biosynthesis protein FliQ [Rhizobium sp. CFBP 13726]